MTSLLSAFRPTLPDGVRFEQLRDRLVLTSERGLTGHGSGVFAEPTTFAAFTPAPNPGPAGTQLLGFAFTQFAMPVHAGADLAFDFNPASNLNSPPAVVPLLLRSGERVTLLAPLDSWHEQLIAVHTLADGSRELRWGWHGDLSEIPAGFQTTLGIFEGTSARELFRQWGQQVMAAAGTQRRPAGSDPIVSHLSYWTDNGAAYWYRTEPDLDLTTTLANKLDELKDLQVPVMAVEVDSWFYRHEVPRAVAAVGYPEEVPPTGMLEWDARPDVLPDGVDALADRLGRPPLTLHSRHISSQSPYTETGDWWIDEQRGVAAPEDPAFYRRWFDDAKRWGATCLQQDWMLLYWFGVRQLREAPGRALDWQRGLDQAADDTEMSLIWCMATPGDLMATVHLRNLVAIRTSDDYRFAEDPALLWHWYLTVNRFVDALDLVAHKDCFFSAHDANALVGPGSASHVGSELDGDPYPDVEALLAAFSGGVAGIGDRIGRTDRDLVMRMCDDDGRLLSSERPLAIADQSLFRSWTDASGLLWATTRLPALGNHDGEGNAQANTDVVVVVALHTATTDEAITDTFVLPTDGIERGVYEWRTGKAWAATDIAASLARRDWALFICPPVEVDADGRRTISVGDPSKYATTRRFDSSEAEAQASSISAVFEV